LVGQVRAGTRPQIISKHYDNQERIDLAKEMVEQGRSFEQQAWDLVNNFRISPIGGYSKSYYEADLKMNAMIVTLLERLLQQKQ
jgi:hypothetical protein